MYDPKVKLQDKVFITPILDWSTQGRSTDTSIDIRLGQRFWVPKRAKLEKLDHLDDARTEVLKKYKEEHIVLIGDYFVLHPRQFVLGESLEWIHLPSSKSAYVIGRSSWGRDGLVIATATGVHSNFSGILTLEITNLGEIPVFLYPGARIAQLFIHEVVHTGIINISEAGQRGQTHAGSINALGSDEEIIKAIAHERGFRKQ